MSDYTAAQIAYWERQRLRLNREFWAKVEIDDQGCWNYTGVIGPYGYGKLVRRGQKINAHKMAWELVHGPVPEGLQVCHHCDNRRCIRTAPDERWPDGHLFLGTPGDNVRDMVAKGRANPYRRPWQTNPATKLNPDKARLIRERRAQGALMREIAAELGVSRGLVQHVMHGRAWRDASD